MRIAIIYLAAITGIEVFTNYYNLTGGVIAHIILLAALIVHSSMVTEPPTRNLLLSLTLAPLTRIMSLSMPLAQFSQVYWYLIIYPSLFAAAWVAMRRLNFTAREIGFTIRKLPLQLLVALSGVIFGVLEYFVLTPKPLVAELTWKSALLPVLALSAGTGIVEEFIFRGVIQRAALEALGKWGLPYVAFLFAIAMFP